MTKEICCLSMGRTGTNYLCELMDNVNNAISLREIFNYDRAYMPNHIFEKVKAKLNLTYDHQMVIMAHEYANFFMDAIRAVAIDLNKEYIFYKIFMTSNNLTLEQLEEIVFMNENAHVIYLERNPLRVYISLIKAKKINIWGKVDTSNVLMTFNKQDFFDHFIKCERFNNRVKQLSQKFNKKILFITYEEITNEKLTDKERLDYFINKVNNFFNLNLESSNNINLENITYFKQDNSKLEDSVKNYDEMINCINSFNMQYLLK